MDQELEKNVIEALSAIANAESNSGWIDKQTAIGALYLIRCPPELRDYFATAALRTCAHQGSTTWLAEEAYRMADAMCIARKNPQ